MTQGLAEIFRVPDPPRSRTSRDPNLGAKYRGAPIPLQGFFWTQTKKSYHNHRPAFRLGAGLASGALTGAITIMDDAHLRD